MAAQKEMAPYTEAMSSLQQTRVRFHLWPFAACHSLSLLCFLSTLQLSCLSNKGTKLTYAADLVDSVRDGQYDFGAAFDGDGVSALLFFSFFRSSKIKAN